MKKFFNILGVIGAIFLTIVLTVLIVSYSLLLNVRRVVSKDGIADVLNNVDVVEVIKSLDDGSAWDEFSSISSELNLTDEQFEEILNSKELKSQFGIVTDKIINAAVSGETVSITKDEVIDVIDLVIDEYNKVADTKITKEERDSLVMEIDDEFIKSINDSLAEINFEDSIDKETKEMLNVIDYILYGSAASVLLIVIVIVIGLIALCRFSYYKWMPYVGVASLFGCVFMCLVGFFLMVVPLTGDAEILKPMVKTLYTNLYISGGILFIIYVVLIILARILKKYHDSKILEIVKD